MTDTPETDRTVRGQFLRFALVGAAGFPIDEGVLALMHGVFGLDPLVARVISISVAMTFTWWGNRMLTFRVEAAEGPAAMAREWLRFVGANGLGALINYGTFAALLRMAPPPFDNAYLATAIGVGVGLIFNFTLSRIYVFRAHHHRDETH